MIRATLRLSRVSAAPGTGERVDRMTGVAVAGGAAATSSSGRPLQELSLNHEKIVSK